MIVARPLRQGPPRLRKTPYGYLAVSKTKGLVGVGIAVIGSGRADALQRFEVAIQAWAKLSEGEQ